MYRCITEVRGLVFDIDSFENVVFGDIYNLFKKYKLLFITVSEEKAAVIENEIGKFGVKILNSGYLQFGPNPNIHVEILRRLDVSATEVLYISSRLGFIKNAMGFMGGTVWITNKVDYTDVSIAPDLICGNLKAFSNLLENDVRGFLGEVKVYPDCSDKMGLVIPVRYESECGIFPMYMLGRYYSKSQYMYMLHPYSSAVSLNKHEGSKIFGVYNDLFEKMIAFVVERLKRNDKIDGICSVPTRPGRKERFVGMLSHISQKYNVINYGPSFTCSVDYPAQKSLSYNERHENIRGVFSFEEELHGERIVIIDDVITTGATMNECIKILKEAGAGDIYIIVLAVNQYGLNYWSSNEIVINCPNCGQRMNLLINSRNRSFFYSCKSCHKTMNFSEGREMVEKAVKNELF